MGLAEPRKRIKLSNHPRNTQWTGDATSFGHKYMLQSGWTPGTALGASSIPVPASEAYSAKVKISAKDDTLGLGASLKSKSVEHQRTGLDAFQGLLGRLNAKDEAQVAAVERKIEDKKLAIYAMGRWGGMTFVPGGKLVQDDPTKKIQVLESSSALGKNQETQSQISEHGGKDETEIEAEVGEEQQTTVETPEERLKRKAEKKLRKEERQAKKEAKRLKKLQKAGAHEGQSENDTPVSETQPSDLTDSRTTTGTSTPISGTEGSAQKLNVAAITQNRLNNGRHLLRGRNIQAKRLAFSDAKGLDQIFMKQAQQTKA